MHAEPPPPPKKKKKNHNMRNRRMRVCSSLLKLRNKLMAINFLLAIRLSKSRSINYSKHNRTNKISYVRQVQKKSC